MKGLNFKRNFIFVAVAAVFAFNSFAEKVPALTGTRT